jgi:competence protein ComEC
MVSSGHDRPELISHAETGSAPPCQPVCMPRPVLKVQRYPLFVAAVAIAIGIVIDRYQQLPFAGYAAVVVTGIMLWGLARREGKPVLAWWAVAIGFCSVGAMHHHITLLIPERADLQPLLNDELLLIRLQGEIVDAPVLFVAPESRWDGERPQDDLTRFEMRCSHILRNGSWQPITGSVQVDVGGQLDGLAMGDQVEASGWASELPDRRNPGQRDVRPMLRGRGLCGILRVEQPSLISVLQRNDSLRSRVRRFLRSRFETSLREGVDAGTLPVAQAILLGDRSLLRTELRSVFVESGTMHLLAISGLHVGIVALFLYGLSRGLRLPPRIATLVMLAILALYIDAADSRPPMIRAFVLIVIWSVSRLLNRPSFSGNNLSAAALVLLALNPTSLFDVGAQLSFLAVATIMWCVVIGRRRDDQRGVDIAVAPDSPRARDALRPPWQRWLFAGLRSLRRPLAISGAIWGVSAPLAAVTFRILAPIGILLNVVLIPLVGVALCFGFLGMLVGVLDLDIGAVPLAAFDSLLRLMMWIAAEAARFEQGHLAIGNIPLWWVCCFYGVVAAAMLGTVWRFRPAWLWSAAVLWLVFGFVLPSSFAKSQSKDLTCTVLSVGHGLSIVIETPDGRIFVYDCGAAGRPQAAALTLQRFLLDRGVTEIDGLLVSHSDADHFNGIEQLAETMAIDRLLLSRHFPDVNQPGTTELIDTADRSGIPIEVIERGDRLRLDPSVSMEILHPTASDQFDSDNAASVVLQIEYAGKRILLTGDLEEDGLRMLMRQPRRDVDVLLAPHHGALAASPPEFVTWAQPRFVVASARRRFDPQALEARYGLDTQVLTTSRSGAVAFQIAETGNLTVQEFLSEAAR